MKLKQKPAFRRACKKQHPKQKEIIDQAICTIKKNPKIGQKKIGDLAGLRVYKFKVGNQELLIGYTYDDTAGLVTLYALGTRQNFYTTLKNRIFP